MNDTDMTTGVRPMRAIGYVRVSTTEQADSRLGLDAQRRALTDEAARRGWDLELIEDAGFTARSANRPGLRRALTMLRTRQVDILMVTKLDRLSRSVQDFGEMLNRATRQRWSLVVVDVNVDTTTPNGRLVANILMAVAAWESEMIGSRTRDAMAEAKLSRNITYGRERMADDTTVTRIHTLRAEGLSFSRIAASLDSDGTPTPNAGKRWYGSTVSRLYQATQTSESAA